MEIYTVGDILIKRDRNEKEMDHRYEIISMIPLTDIFLVSKINKKENEFDSIMSSKQIYENFIIVSK